MKRSIGFPALLTGLLCLMLPLPSVQAGLLSGLTQSAPKRVELTDTSDRSAVYKEAFTPSGAFSRTPAPIDNGIRKVAIAGFQVEFATEQKAILRGNGAGAGLASTTDVIYTLKGVTDAQMQSIADKLYDAFVADLRARGYEVLPTSALAQTGYAENLQKAGQPPEHHERGAALDLVITPTEKEVDNASVIVTARDTAPDVFSKYGAGFGPGPRAADALQANIVHVRLKINFARFEETGWFNPEIDNKPQDLLSPNGTFMQVFKPGGLFTLYPLANSVILPHRLAETANPVAATAEQTTQRAAGGAARAIGGLFKGGIAGLADIAGGAVASAHSVMASGNYEVVAGENYEDLVTQDGALAVSLLTEPFPQ